MFRTKRGHSTTNTIQKQKLRNRLQLGWRQWVPSSYTFLNFVGSSRAPQASRNISHVCSPSFGVTTELALSEHVAAFVRSYVA